MNLTVSDAFHVALAVLASLGGGTAIVLALSGWLGKVWADRLMENNVAKHNRELEELKSKFEAVNKKIQSELDKTLHVHNAQFETEFRALTDIWVKVSKVRSAICASPPDFTPKTSKLEKLESLGPLVRNIETELRELKLAALDHSPFYPQDIYEKVGDLIDIVVTEETRLKRDYLAGEENAVCFWFNSNQTFTDQVFDLANQISELMRKRIEKLSTYKD